MTIECTKEQRMLAYVLENAAKNDPSSVIKTIDSFCSQSGNWMMHAGNAKGSDVDKIIKKHKPKEIVELGAYCGYSAVRFASVGRSANPEFRYISFELNPVFANIAKAVVEHAGLSNVVTFVIGPFNEKYSYLKEIGLETIDMFFIDHWKDAYLPDAKLIMDKKLVHSGSVLLADNVIKPGTPEYLEFVRSSPQFSFNETLESSFEYSEEVDAVQYSIVA